jgi:diguanylate cyclase (GGDEF)-like protein
LSGNRRLQNLILVFIGAAYFFCTFFGLFFHLTKVFYPFVLLPLFGILLIVKKPSLVTLGFGLILTNFAIQITGAGLSFLFFFYFVIISLIGLFSGKKSFIISSSLIVIAETGSYFFHHRLWSVAPIVTVVLYVPLVGFFIYRERKIRSDLEKKLAGFLAKQGLVAPAGIDRSVRVQPLTGAVPVVDIEPSFRYVIQVVKELFSPNSVAIFLAGNENFVLTQGWSSDPAFLPQAQINPGQGFISWVAKEHKPLLITEFVQDARTLGYYSQPILIRSFLAVPILLDENLLGVIAVDSKTVNSLGIEARDALLSLAQVLAHFIETIRSYEAVHREALRFSALSELSSTLLKEIKTENVITSALSVVDTLFKPDQMGFAQTDPGKTTGSLRAYTGRGTIKIGFKFNFDDGLVGWVAKHNKYLINHNLGENMVYRLAPAEPRTPGRSFLGVPVEKDDRCIGVLWLEKNDRPAFSEKDAAILKLVASLLSIALIRANLYEQIADLAIRDSLTGLYNHRKFQEILDEQLVRSQELVLLFLDLDHFKEINDRFGHPFGDTVLVKVAKVLTSLRSSIAARYGGEEFAVILPNCSPEHGVNQAEALRQAIKNLSFELEENAVKITTSIGVAFFPTSGQKKWQLISIADEALYQAKEQGRDRVVASQPR